MRKDAALKWAFEMFRTSRLLALGSFLLLIGMAIVLALFYLYAYPALVVVALVVHALAWIKLSRLSRRTRGMLWAFRGSIVGFAIGLVTLPWVPLPAVPGAFVFAGPVFFWSGGFAFVPSVFAPVVIAHAVLFLQGLTSLRSRFALLLLVAGAGFLVADATIAIAAQASLLSQVLLPILTLSGATAVGYALIGAAWWHESTTRNVRPTIARLDMS